MDGDPKSWVRGTSVNGEERLEVALTAGLVLTLGGVEVEAALEAEVSCASAIEAASDPVAICRRWLGSAPYHSYSSVEFHISEGSQLELWSSGEHEHHVYSPIEGSISEPWPSASVMFWPIRSG